MNDKHYYLIETLKAVQNGWEPPDEISRDEYYKIKSNQDENPRLTGFVGFACSFGGKWWGGYAKNNSGTNYAKQSKNSLLKKMKGLNEAVFKNEDYRDIAVSKNSVVYADPPYKGTTSYSNSHEFNHDEFWEHMRNLSKDNLVFISEVSSPDDFIPIWEKPFKRVLDVNKNNIFNSTEKLFVHRSILNKINK